MRETELVAMRAKVAAMRLKIAGARRAVKKLLAASESNATTPEDRSRQARAAARLLAVFEAEVIAGR